MSLLTIIIVIVVFGVILWAVNAYVPMEPGLKRLLTIVVIVGIVLWLLTGIFNSSFPNIRIGE